MYREISWFLGTTLFNRDLPESKTKYLHPKVTYIYLNSLGLGCAANKLTATVQHPP
jgi:hypothetical protein